MRGHFIAGRETEREGRDKKGKVRNGLEKNEALLLALDEIMYTHSLPVNAVSEPSFEAVFELKVDERNVPVH